MQEVQPKNFMNYLSVRTCSWNNTSVLSAVRFAFTTMRFNI